MRLKIAAALVLGAAFSLGAQAKPVSGCVPTGDVMRPCAYQPNFLAGVRSIRVRMHRVKQSALQRVPEGQQMASGVVPNPSGCPARLFCGCGAAVRVFGSPIRSLWAAASWYKFPRSAPSPGMVAVRRHHVFVLEADQGNGQWTVYDANSGRGLTRIHTRSIAGYSIVNPHG